MPSNPFQLLADDDEEDLGTVVKAPQEPAKAVKPAAAQGQAPKAKAAKESKPPSSDKKEEVAPRSQAPRQREFYLSQHLLIYQASLVLLLRRVALLTTANLSRSPRVKIVLAAPPVLAMRAVRAVKATISATSVTATSGWVFRFSPLS
jgi:hypothetical protein